MNEYEILQKIKSSYQNILDKKLVGIYVHGSIAFKCFNWDKSDIDFLVVVNAQLTQEEKEALISELLTLDKYCPLKGLEMSVVLESACKPFVYPTPFELHFSNAHRENAKNDLSVYCEYMNGVDKDLAAHFTVINRVGVVLCGKEISEIFAPVPKEFYLDSILGDVQDAKDEIQEDAVYYVLNLCRVLAYKEEELILSKVQGSEWGMKKLPTKYRGLIRNALGAYSGKQVFLENEVLDDFADYMTQRIKTE